MKFAHQHQTVGKSPDCVGYGQPERDRTGHSQGALGSGNHFIEVSLDEEDRVWLFLHSGSRGVGNKISMRHIKVAQELCRTWWISLPDPDLAYLVEGTDEFWAYIRELRWAQHFALLNREEMMDRVVSSFEAWVGADVVESERINCHHNYTVQEKHFGKKVWLSRIRVPSTLARAFPA